MRAFPSLRRLLRGAWQYAWALWGAVRYGFPGRGMVLVAVTGTDGKSSTVMLVAAMLREAGYRTAHYSTATICDGATEYLNESKMTTPGRGGLQAFLRRARRTGCTHAVLEITSQGIAQHRHRFLQFRAVGITNITPEHVEAHGSFAAYARTKLSLLRHLGSPGAAVLGEAVAARYQPDLAGLRYRIATVGESAAADYRFCCEASSFTHTTTRFCPRAREVAIENSFGGPFVSRNVAFAGALACELGVSVAVVAAGARRVGIVPGRFEVVHERPWVIVDYGHTLAALQELLPYVRARANGRIVHVFGAAGGGRDRSKRPMLAALSEEAADESVLTEENSFDEPVAGILSSIAQGFSPQHPFSIIERREEAVSFAKSRLRNKDDILLLTAKGSETVIAGPGGSKRPYNERQFARCLFDAPQSD